MTGVQTCALPISGGTPQKPVGTVCFGWGGKGGPVHAAVKHFDGDREAVRRQAVVFALEQVLAVAGDGSIRR